MFPATTRLTWSNDYMTKVLHVMQNMDNILWFVLFSKMKAVIELHTFITININICIFIIPVVGELRRHKNSANVTQNFEDILAMMPFMKATSMFFLSLYVWTKWSWEYNRQFLWGPIRRLICLSLAILCTLHTVPQFTCNPQLSSRVQHGTFLCQTIE